MIINSFRKSCHLWDVKTNIVAQGRLQGARALHVGYLRLQTHTQYVIITAFPQQQLLHEGASILRYNYIACFVFKNLGLILQLTSYVFAYLCTYLKVTKSAETCCNEL